MFINVKINDDNDDVIIIINNNNIKVIINLLRKTKAVISPTYRRS